MASPQKFTILAIVVVLPSVVLATEFIVGDEQGWTTNFDYSKWTTGKTFRVGDSLVFNYSKDNHNVFKVNGVQFKACQVPPANVNNSLTTGHDVVPLKTAGNKWYICGAAGHCNLVSPKL
ncbi:Blue copper protein [Acorus gramineus]|uniref:Blue copper protein n=1 Tax=Acorus gramineus TaxID=55184 RepID=A0AAV9AHX0_ACOGR|nr:Blue copper protein [Acorus gramineus]